MEKTLGREINEYYDPQYVAVYKPNIYIYMANKGSYFFAIHQRNSYPFSRNIAKHYNKVEISNNPTPQNRATPALELLNHEVFKTYLAKPVSKEGFFRNRELKHINETKQ